MKMGTSFRWVGVAGLVCVTGCTSADRAKAPATESAPPFASESPAVAPSSPSAGSSAPSAAAPEASREEAPSPSPSERPGLGTEWGESRFSQVTDVPFLRADGDRPFAVATLRYDDREGVDALVRRHAGEMPSTREVPIARGAITVSIHDADGAPLEGFRLGDRTYVVGRAGERYSIVVSNHSRHRVEAVATVDGLDVINGRPGALANRGYLVDAFGSVEIDGFRQSQDAVAAFRFGRVADSYAAQTGSARDVGVIGVAFFDERGDRVADDDEARLRDSASPFPADRRFAHAPR
jgi:hypothetical protein